MSLFKSRKVVSAPSRPRGDDTPAVTDVNGVYAPINAFDDLNRKKAQQKQKQKRKRSFAKAQKEPVQPIVEKDDASDDVLDDDEGASESGFCAMHVLGAIGAGVFLAICVLGGFGLASRMRAIAEERKEVLAQEQKEAEAEEAAQKKKEDERAEVAAQTQADLAALVAAMLGQAPSQDGNGATTNVETTEGASASGSGGAQTQSPLAVEAAPQVACPNVCQLQTLCEKWITVQPGDTLEAISNIVGVPVSQIVALNGLCDPDRIYPGQVLRVW